MKNNLRVLVVSEKYWPQGGGAELATHLILEKIKDEFDITVVTGVKKPEILHGVKYSYDTLLDANNKIQLWINLLANKSYFESIIKQFDIVYIPRLAYPIIDVAKKSGKKVVVHLHDYQPLSFEAYVSSPFEENYKSDLINDIKKTCRTEVLKDSGLVKSILSMGLTPVNRLVRYWIAMADSIICVSERQSEIFKMAMPEVFDKFKVVYNPLPYISYIPKKLNERAFLYIGGSQYVKGIHILVQASIRLLRKEKAKFILTKISDTDWQTHFKRLNKHYDNSYLVFKRLNYKDILRVHSQASALIMPSIWEEPLPYSIFEAMLAGTAPIATRVGGIPEIVKGTFAEKMLFTPGSVEDLVDKMEWILSLSSEERISKGKKLRDHTLQKFGQIDHRWLFSKIFS